LKDPQLNREQENYQEQEEAETEEIRSAEAASEGGAAENDVCQCQKQAEEELEQLKQQWEQERADLVNQLLRLKADFDNFRRRSEAQIESIRATANQNLLVELLPVIDNFERAIDAGKDDSPYLAGVKMIFGQLMDCLYKQGLTPIDAVGKPFDPNLHEAVSMEGDPGQDLIVISELQKGYLYKDKLLRASMVKVAPEQQHEEE